MAFNTVVGDTAQDMTSSASAAADAISDFIPGVDYTAYFKAAIKAAKLSGDKNQVKILTNQQKLWKGSQKVQSPSTLTATEALAEKKKVQAAVNQAVKDINAAIDQKKVLIGGAKAPAAKKEGKAKLAELLQDTTAKAYDAITTVSTASKKVAQDSTLKSMVDSYMKTGTWGDKVDYTLTKQAMDEVTKLQEAKYADKPTPRTEATDLPGAMDDYYKTGKLPDPNSPLYKQVVSKIAGGQPPAGYGEEEYWRKQAENKVDNKPPPATQTPSTTQPQMDTSGINSLIALLLGGSMRTPPQQQGVPQGNITLPQDYQTRQAVQDQMLVNQQNNVYQPNLAANIQAQQQRIAMQRLGLDQNVQAPMQGAGFSAPPVNMAAGGYLDATSGVSQPSGGFTIGANAIPNMSQYTQYEKNPGISTPTTQGDDGQTGGVPVPGQTNPLW